MIKLIDNFHQMVNFTNHTADNRTIFLLNNLRNLVKTQGLEGALLIYGITDLALNLPTG